MSTKGSWQRPVNKKVFDENWSRIFEKMEAEKDWVTKEKETRKRIKKNNG